MTIENLSSNKSFGGWHKQYSHPSDSLGCAMCFAIYLPPQVANGHKVPVLYWLSGLTCTDENFMQKAGAHRVAAELGMAIVAPDTSPRGEGVADDESYDLGQGAGFYVNATEGPWNRHYRMYDYVLNELPALVESVFPVNDQRSIAGHSMGGHGALVLALRNPERYQSVSALSPISNPVNCPWGGESLYSLSGKRKRSLGELRRQPADAGGPAVCTGTGRPGGRRQFPSGTAPSRGFKGCGRHYQLPSRAEHSRGLRP